MRPNKSIKYSDEMLDVLRHLKECGVCLSRVTACVRGIPEGEASRLLEHVRQCALAALGRN